MINAQRQRPTSAAGPSSPQQTAMALGGKSPAKPPRVASIRDEQHPWETRAPIDVPLPRSMFKPVLLTNSASGSAAEAVSFRLDLSQLGKRDSRRRNAWNNW